MTNWDNGYDCGFSYGHRKAIEECGNLMREQKDRMAELSRRLNNMTLKYLHTKCGHDADAAQVARYEANEAHINAPSGDEAPVKFMTLYITEEV